MSRQRVRVFCDGACHRGKVAFIGWLEFMDSGGGVHLLRGGNERLINNRPVPTADLFGTVRRPPTRPPSDHDRARSRHRFACELCRLDVPVRNEKASRIAWKLLQAGVERISLQALAGIVSK